jgi:hypothetical protein
VQIRTRALSTLQCRLTMPCCKRMDASVITGWHVPTCVFHTYHNMWIKGQGSDFGWHLCAMVYTVDALVALRISAAAY